MNFMDAFAKVNKPAAAPTAPAQVQQQQPSFTDDDLKAYIDAKFEALKSDLMSVTSEDKGTNTTVETPQETKQAESNNIIEEGGNDNASSTDL